MNHFRIVTGTDEHAKIEWSTDVNGNIHTTILKNKSFHSLDTFHFGRAEGKNEH